MDYNELAKRAHETAVMHGFWEKDYSDEHCLMMVITEVAEAVQAHRSNKRVNELVLSIQQTNLVSADFIYERVIKGTVEDEFADIVIRLLDFAGKNGLILDYESNDCFEDFEHLSFTEVAYDFIFQYITLLSYTCQNVVLVNALYYMEKWTGHLGIDLEKYVNIKMDYNEWRPYKHGKEY